MREFDTILLLFKLKLLHLFCNSIYSVELRLSYLCHVFVIMYKPLMRLKLLTRKYNIYSVYIPKC